MRYRTARLACTFLRRRWASGLLLSRSEATSAATALPQWGGPIPLPLSGRGSHSESYWGGGSQRHLGGDCPIVPTAASAWHPPGVCRGACRGSLVGNSGAGAGGRALAAESKVDHFDLIAVEEGLTRVDGCGAGRSMAFKGLHCPLLWYSDTGFVVNETAVEGPLLCLRSSYLLWDVTAAGGLTAASLAPLLLLVPPPDLVAKGTGRMLVAVLTVDVACWAADLVVLGTGGTLSPIPPEVATLLAQRRIGVEVSSTVNAMATFNILAQEGRHVAGALLPVSFSAASAPT